MGIVELDPDDTSVSYGGLPEADGVVIDAWCMHGPKRWAGEGRLEGRVRPRDFIDLRSTGNGSLPPKAGLDSCSANGR